MDDSKTEISGFLKRIQLIHKAIMTSPIIAGIIVYQLADNPYLLIKAAWDMLLVVVLSGIILGFYFSDLLFKNYLSKISTNTSLFKKLQGYQAAFLFKMALLEIPALISAGIFILTQNQLYLIIIGGIVVYMSFHAPKKEKIILALDLRGAERDKVNQAL